MTTWLRRTAGEITTGARDGFWWFGERLNLGYAVAIGALVVWFVAR